MSQGRCERTRPHVLVDEDGRRVAGLLYLARVVDLVLTEQSRRGPLEDGEVEIVVAGQVGEFDPLDRSVRALADEEQIQHPDDATVDQIDQKGQPLAGHPTPGKL